MRSGQGESGAGVVEFAVSPKHRIVATLACCREMGRHVIHRRSGCVVVGLMATHAGGCGDVVIPVYVTIQALTRRHGVRSSQGESGAGVVELAVGPKHRVMAALARRREVGSHVVHRGEGRVVVGLMAAHAGRSGDVVVVIDVAVRTLPRWHRVRSGQREPGGAVAEGCIQPTGRAVALLAGLWEVRRHVIRIRRALEILQVTAHASGAGQVVIVVNVAIDALARRHGMRTGQNESGRGVIELAIGPGHRVVTLLAGGRESGMRHRRRRRVVVGLVATDTGGRGDVVIVVDVTIRAQARGHGVRTRQNEACRRVIELAVGPGHRVVTLLARSRESCMRHRRGRRVVVGLMAADAGSRGDVVVVVDVTVRALTRRHGMRSAQREPGGAVVEGCIQPTGRVVTLLTGLREIRRHVIRIRRALEIFQVAGHARGARQVVIAVDVAVGALPRRNRMCAGESEPRG